MKLKGILPVLGLILFLAPSLLPFDLIDPAGGNKDPHVAPPFAHWDLRAFANCEIPYAINQGSLTVDDVNGDGNIDADDITAIVGAIDNGFQQWEDVVPALIQFNNAGNTATRAVADDGENVVFFDNDFADGDPWDASFAGDPIALTWVRSNAATGIISDIDIVADDFRYGWNIGNQDYNNQNLDIWAIMVHEIGHFCALADNNDLGTGAERCETYGNGDYTFPAQTDPYHLLFTINGTAIDVEIPAGTQTAAQIAILINAAIAAQAPGMGAATATNSGSIRINATNAAHDIIITGGDATAILDFEVGESGISTMNQPDPRGLQTLDQRTLSRDDRDGLNFLYTHDLGDAPDAPFPSKVQVNDDGAAHLFGNQISGYQYETIGAGIDDNEAECDALLTDLDFDDGITFIPNPPLCGESLLIIMDVQTFADNDGNSHNYGTPMYANLWIDLNVNGVWEEGGEHPIDSRALAAAAKCSTTVFFPYTEETVWVRGRLDWGEDVSRVTQTDPTLNLVRGAAQLGEVEDWPLTCLMPDILELLYWPVYSKKWWTYYGSPVLETPWMYTYQTVGKSLPVAEWIIGELDFRAAHPELDGQDVLLSLYRPRPLDVLLWPTDWHQEIHRFQWTGSIMGVSMGFPDGGTGWDYLPLSALPTVEWRIPVIAPVEVGTNVPDTIYTAVNLQEYMYSNPLGFNGGEWEAGLTLADLGVDIINGEVAGLAGIYFATSPFSFEPNSVTGFNPDGGVSTLLNSSDFYTDLIIIEEKSNRYLITSHGCCVGESVGNMDVEGGIPDMGDLTLLIDMLFISLNELPCLAEANVDFLPPGSMPNPVPTDITMGDLTVLIDNLFISLNPLPPCP